MPDRRRVPLPFGEGLDRETGSMVVRPTRMDDVRNVYFRRGKLVVRRGLEQKLTFQDSAGNPATHVLAGESLSSERSGVVVAYEQDITGEVNVYQIDADATVGDRIGTWFTQEVGQPPPIVITAESYGRVFLAHDELREPQRERTVVYDPRKGTTLQDLESDLRGEGDEKIHFRGVTRHLAYIFGYGFGTSQEDRPELVRASLPGAPQQFRPEHYWIVGDRRDPVMGVYRAGTSALVFKEAETHEIFGSGRDDFGQRPLDTLHGILAPRLAVTVGDAVYGWSAEGPRRWQSGTEGSEDLAIPLDLEGFEPTDLVDRGTLRQGFAHYIPSERLVVFVFGRRVYALSIRGQKPEWTYFELGVTPHCAFTLRSHGPGTGAEDQSAPTGHPEYLDNITPRDNDELRPQWKNVGQDGDERVNIWTRELENLADDWQMEVDSDGDGVVDGWTETDDANLTTTFSNDQDAQKIEVTAASGAGFSYVEKQDITTDPVVAGDEYGISVALQADAFANTAKARLVYRWFDDTDTQIGSDNVVDDSSAPAEFERVFEILATAPAGAVRLDVLVGFRAEASGDTGTVWFREVVTDPTAQRGAWDEQGSFLVATTAEQDQILSGFEPGSTHQVALRYRRSVFVTAGYEGDDPMQWPVSSRGVASTPIQAASLEFQHWWYGETSLGNTGHGLRFAINYEDGVQQRLEDAVADGKSAGVEVWRKRPGVAGETEFQLIDTLSGAPDLYEDDALGEDTTAEAEEEFEYKIRTFILNTRSGFSDVVTIWPGPTGPPSELGAFIEDETNEIARIAWTNHTSPLDIWGFGYWCDEVAAVTDRVKAETRVDRRNVTQGTGWTVGWSSQLDCTKDSVDEDLSTLTDGETIEYRARHRVSITGDVFYSDYSNVDDVVVPT